MDAPIYPPATHYVQPAAVPYRVSLATLPVSELMAWPAAWAIVVRHLPMVRMMVGTQQFAPIASNMTLPDLRTFIGPDMDPQFAQIDAELARLPAAGKPAW